MSVPAGLWRSPTQLEKDWLDLVERGTTLCDIFSNSDHQILFRENAATMNFGADVQRMYISRAYRFNQWGLRSIAFVVPDITTFQSTYSSDISAADTWATNSANATAIDLEIRNMFYDQLDTSALTNAGVIRLKGHVDDAIADLKANGVTGLLNDLKTNMNSFSTTRTTLFSGVATALQAGTNPSISFSQSSSIHAPIFKLIWVIVTFIWCIIRFLCRLMRKTQEWAQRWYQEDQECQAAWPAT